LWAIGIFFYSSLTKWVSREEDYSQKRASVRGPSFSDAISLGDGHLGSSLY
jgi:hypothetical protein